MLTQQSKLATVFQYVGALHDSAGRSLRLFPSPIIGRTPRSMEEEGLLGKVACEFLLLAASARYRLVQGMYVMLCVCYVLNPWCCKGTEIRKVHKDFLLIIWQFLVGGKFFVHGYIQGFPVLHHWGRVLLLRLHLSPMGSPCCQKIQCLIASKEWHLLPAEEFISRVCHAFASQCE